MKSSAKSSKSGSALRRRAEARLGGQPVKGASPATEAKTLRLLHELQVHQIELELQNEELQQAKAEVDANLERYTDLYDFAPVGYFSMNEAGVILEVNLTGASQLGTERSRLTNRRFQLFIDPQKRAAFEGFLKCIFAGHKKQACETMLLREGRPAFWADLQAMSAFAHKDTPKWCRVAVIDVSARKHAEEVQRRVEALDAKNRHLEAEIIRRQAVEAALKNSEQHALRSLVEAHQLQEQLRQISRQFLAVEENLRKEISRELHDKICQLLVGINMHLAIFAKTALKNPEAIGQTIDPLRRLVADGVRIVHRFARDLRPSALDDLGLIPALNSYIDEFPKQKGRRIKLVAYEGVEALSNDKLTVLYRVVQEALVNASKHAEASLIKVTIRKAKAAICLEVVDNGKGFPAKSQLSAKGRQRLGMVGMRERVEMVGGRFSVSSKSGKGVVIQALMPAD